MHQIPKEMKHSVVVKSYNLPVYAWFFFVLTSARGHLELTVRCKFLFCVDGLTVTLSSFLESKHDASILLFRCFMCSFFYNTGTFKSFMFLVITNFHANSIFQIDSSIFFSLEMCKFYKCMVMFIIKNKMIKHLEVLSAGSGIYRILYLSLQYSWFYNFKFPAKASGVKISKIFIIVKEQLFDFYWRPERNLRSGFFLFFLQSYLSYPAFLCCFVYLDF